MEPPPIRAELRVQTVCIATMTVIALGFALWWLQAVMIPFIVAAFLAIALRPLVDVLEKYVRLPRAIGSCIVMLLAIAALIGIGIFVTISANQASPKAETEPTVADVVPDVKPVDDLTVKKPDIEIIEEYESQLNQILQRILQMWPITLLDMDEQQAVQYATNFGKSVVTNLIVGVPNAILAVVSQSAVVMVFLFFLLLGSSRRDRPVGGTWGEAENQIRTYLIEMTAISAATGALVGAILTVLGVNGALLFGLLAFLLNFIPNIGSMIATVLPVPVVWLSPEFSMTTKVLAVALPAAVQMIIGNFIQPKLMGDSLKLHPVVIVMALIVWGMLWGIVGMFLAVPITSIIRIICAKHALTRPVAELMAGNLAALREDLPSCPDEAQSAPAAPPVTK